jgi:hypothetical protein
MGRIITTPLLEDKLVAFWNLDDASNSNPVVSSYGSYSLNLFEGFTSIAGKINQGVEFYGEHQGLWTNEQLWNLLTNPTSFSVSFWHKIPDNTQDPFTVMGNAFGSMGFHFDYYNFGHGYDGSYDLNWVPGSYGISFRMSGSADPAWNAIYANEATPNNTWTLVTATYDLPTTTMKLYLNGVLKASYNNANTGEFINPDWHGFALNGSVMPDGKEYGVNQCFDALGFWSRALNQNEISILYNGGNGRQYKFIDNKNKVSIKKQNLGGGKLKTFQNLLKNSKFDQDNNYPFDGFDANYFMGGVFDAGSVILSNYYHNSPLFYSSTFRTLFNKTFHEINYPYNILLYSHALQPRLFKMFGVGSKFGSLNFTNYLKTITSTTSFAPTDNQSWVKYGAEQIIPIPSWARKVKYGVKYLIIGGDQFRSNNFGGLCVYFQKGRNRSYVNINMIRNPVSVETAFLDNLEGFYGLNTYINFDANAGANAMCQWLGPNTSRVKVKRRPSKYINAPDLDVFNVLSDAIDIPNFSSSGGSPDYNNGFPEYVSIQMFFAEWVSYLNDSGILSGAIYYYEPFLYFTEF